jgi:hypothetical protein
MKFNVTFRCTLPIDLDKHPTGEELAEFLVAQFCSAGLNIHIDDNSPDYAWSLKFKDRSSTPWLLVGYVGDDVYEWLAQINSGVGWFGRLRGRADDALREEVTLKLHDILTSDNNFSHIRWHTGDFGEPGWTPTPAEPG